VFAATTSAELAGVISNETGSGVLVFGTSPTFTTDITTPKIIWTGTVQDSSGSGTPEGSVTAPVGSVYRRTDGGTATTLYVKESGAGNTGWAAVGVSLSGTNTWTNAQTYNVPMIWQHTTTPTNPSAGFVKVYSKTDNQIYSLNSSGIESNLSLSNSFENVRVATTTVASSIVTDMENGDVIDGITLATNDRILVKESTGGQTTYGIYIVGSPATRAPDLNTAAQFIPGKTVTVLFGTINGGRTYRLSTPNPMVVNTDYVEWSCISTSTSGTLGFGSIILGRGAARLNPNSTQTIAIGDGAGSSNTGAENLYIGAGSLSNVTSGQGWTGVGTANTAAGTLTSTTGGTTLGYGATVHNGSVAIGYNTANTASQQFVSGSTAAPIVDVHFSEGVTNATPISFTINGTGGSGTNIAGANIQLAGGKGTGTAEPGLTIIKYPLKTTTGTALQSLSTQSYPINTTMFTGNTSNVTVSAATVGTTETTIIGTVTGSLSLEGGMLRVGRILKFRLHTSVTTSGTPVTFRIRGYKGTTVLVDTGALTMTASLTGSQGWIDCNILCRTVGSSGTVVSSGLWVIQTATAAGFNTTQSAILTSLSDVTVNTTTTENLNWTITYSASTAGNSITVPTISCEVLN
jgi:hypothetical protein